MWRWAAPGMTEIQLRTLIEHGASVQLTAMSRALNLPGYTLAIDTGQVVRQELVAQRGNTRVFKQLETLVKFCRELGVNGFEVRV